MLLLQTGIFLLAVVFTGILRQLALRRQVLDVPRPRSAHRTPMPTAGGLSLVVLVFAVSTGAVLTAVLPLSVYLALYGAFVVALAGLLDDLRGLSIRQRVTTHFLAAIWCLYWLGELTPINLGGWLLEARWLLYLLALFALVWLLNLYNFMDGTDGLAASELVFVSVLAAWLGWQAGTAELSLLAGTLAAAGAGFLVWNWPPAKIFMGDVGSGFCGFMLGLLALLSMQSGAMNPWTWLVLLGGFVTDATLTLLRRAATGQHWYQSHASHAYQQLARRCNSHRAVTIILWMINCLWLAPLAWLTVKAQDQAVYICILALTPLALVVWRLDAGRESTPAGGGKPP